MIVEVKQAVAAKFLTINSHDAIEMIIYCYYLIRLNNLKQALGMILIKARPTM